MKLDGFNKTSADKDYLTNAISLAFVSSDSTKLAFIDREQLPVSIGSWKVVSTENDKVTIKITFSDPNSVSEFSLDKDAIQLNNTQGYSKTVLIQP